jgi:hypothetical protein
MGVTELKFMAALVKLTSDDDDQDLGREALRRLGWWRKHFANDAPLAASGSGQTSQGSLRERDRARWHQCGFNLLV